MAREGGGAARQGGARTEEAGTEGDWAGAEGGRGRWHPTLICPASAAIGKVEIIYIFFVSFCFFLGGRARSPHAYNVTL